MFANINVVAKHPQRRIHTVSAAGFGVFFQLTIHPDQQLFIVPGETNTGVGPNETKAIRGLVASTWSRRKRRMLTR